jgi:hypothetical protein
VGVIDSLSSFGAPNWKHKYVLKEEFKKRGQTNKRKHVEMNFPQCLNETPILSRTISKSLIGWVKSIGDDCKEYFQQ